MEEPVHEELIYVHHLQNDYEKLSSETRELVKKLDSTQKALDERNDDELTVTKLRSELADLHIKLYVFSVPSLPGTDG